jgi:hypothetical protein
MRTILPLAALVFFAACGSDAVNISPDVGGQDGGSSSDGQSTGSDSGQGGGPDASPFDSSGGGPDFGSSGPDSGGPVDTGITGQDDGTPTRQNCSGNFGSALDTSHGRLDGFLVSIVPPGGPHSCNGDSGHVHFQVLMQGSIYDVAVNTDTLQLAKDVGLPDGPWSEGWHTSDDLDYVSLGLHSGDFSTPSDPAGAIESFVMNANHVSIFATGYGPTGCHDVHRRNGGNDGAIIIDPLSATPHGLFFHFNTQSF